MHNIQQAKGEALKALHRREGLFVIANPWDAGSAKMLAALGFEALATTSAGLAFSLGKADGISVVTREETLENARVIVEAVPLPVSLVGGSIEDTTGNSEDPILPFDLAVERVKAAVAAARSLPFTFTLTARAENFIRRRADLPDTIKRLVAFADAGADVLYAPGLATIDDVKAIVTAVAPKPVNVVIGLGKAAFTLGDLAGAGVKRVSIGSSFARVAYSSFFHAAKEIKEGRNFDFGAGIIPYAELNRMFG
ncbi:MAG TPA: isocitrate lyase/phosphoenolpyruvate mutase family protein [Chitinophagaceae bacterium]|nr:isocitrate lyase/phosphoenolpyruvate mutase family protein [Chitinophagaceae bacterium]